MHLTEEDLVLHYYGEDNDRARVERHLVDCDTCRTDFAKLRHTLSLVDAVEVPEPPEGFERTVWARLAPELPARRRWWVPRLLQASPRWVFAGGVVAAVLVSFLAGRLSRSEPTAVVPTTEADVAATDRVLLIELVDHLDRSQIVLVELLNAEDGRAVTTSAEQSRAKELVAANRLYRHSAAQAGDEATGVVLDDLERVLLEIANAPADARVEDLDALRARIASRGLLFRVRVVQSEMRERERRTLIAGSTS